MRNRRNRFEVVAIDARTGDAQTLAGGGTWSRPHWTPAGGVLGEYSDRATAPELRSADGPVHAPAPLSVRRAPHATLEDVAFTSFDGLEIPAFLMRPRSGGPVPAVVHPHGGPTDAFIDDWTATRSTSSRRAMRGWR